MSLRRGRLALKAHASSFALASSIVVRHWMASRVVAMSMLVAWSLAPGIAAAAPAIHPGAVEIGLSGAVTIVEGGARGSAAVDGGIFFCAPGGLAYGGLEVAYAHVSSLDNLDLGVQVAWTRAIGATSLYPFVALAGAVRQEWIGSFAETRYPVGVDLGVRALVASSVNVRLQYRIRRVLGDPVADFTEQELRFGIALLLRNSPAR